MEKIDPIYVKVGAPISLTIHATDPNGKSLTYSISNMPKGATFNAGARYFYWKPANDQVGTFKPVFTAKSETSSVSQTVTMVISASSSTVKPAPVVPPVVPPAIKPEPITPPITPVIPDTTTSADKNFIAKGKTTATYISIDGSGYGVAAPNGPDADPNDPNVNTYQQALSKYGTVSGILKNLGYTSERIFYISVNGNDQTGVVDNIDRPFASWEGVYKLLQPGDAVIFRAGTHKTLGVQIIYNITTRNQKGTASAPITVMGMPGEKVVLNSNGKVTDGGCILIESSSYLNFANFVCDDFSSRYAGYGIRMNYSNNISFADIESKNHHTGLIGMQDLHYITMNRMVMHDNTIEHGIYLGARDEPGSNITIKDSLIYNNNWQGIQINGRMDGVIIENNVIHSNGQVGIQLIQGVKNASIKNNLIFNNEKQAITIYMYDSTNPEIAPYALSGNVIANNTIWVGTQGIYGNYNTDIYPAVLFNDTTSSQKGSMAGNTFKNNIIYTSNGPAFQFSQGKWADSTTIQNNVIYRSGGDDAVLSYGGTKYSFDKFKTFTSGFTNNIFADPQFVSASTGNYLKPNLFDFDLKSSSPAKDFGTLTGAPTWDLRYAKRVGKPDAGAYEL
jgi:hypothetical protein